MKLPLAHVGSGLIHDADARFVALISEESPSNPPSGDRIVRCVNAHDGLVDAVAWLLRTEELNPSCWNDLKPDTDAARNFALAALARAKPEANA